MIAVPVSGEQRQLAVCAPEYLERFGAPSHPRELVAHRCIGWRRAPGIAPFRGNSPNRERVHRRGVAGDHHQRHGIDDKARVAGAGITFGMEESFRPSIDRGELVAA